MSVWDGFNREDEDYEHYTFQYRDGDRHISYSTDKDNDYWPDVLEKFLHFLSSVYGYDIRKKVTVNEPKNLPLNFGDDIGDF